MEALLTELEQEEGFGKTKETYSKDELQAALDQFLAALSDFVPVLQQQEHNDEEKKQDEDGLVGLSVISAQWLIDVCSTVTSELTSHQLARAVWDASQLQDPSGQQEALFTALGASESAMQVLFELAPLLTDIKTSISLEELKGSSFGGKGMEATVMDPAEEERKQLKIDALNAAQFAAIAKAEAEELAGPNLMNGATHTVTRKSEQNANKVAKKAAEKAKKALDRAMAAGAILDPSQLLSIQESAYGDGGLKNRSTDELRAIQKALMPTGSRQYHSEEGLPSGTERDYNDEIGYDRVTIPHTKIDPETVHERLVITNIMDEDCAAVFAGTKSLNPMQSAVYNAAFNTRENLLVCAPTGAGKTNVALLAVAAHFRDVGLIGHGDAPPITTGEKIVYIAPMKALAQEVVEKFGSKLKPLRLIVRELTGDMQLTRAEAQSANVIVTTPEKWDVVTRKSGNDDNSLGNQCGLLIIDEVHLLADERGAVIESVVSRLHRLVESRQRQLRIVGLSATLPNYRDVAEFLQVAEPGLFFFGPEHRPVPLQQSFVGVRGNEKKRYEMEEKMNKVCYETVKDSLQRGYQVMIFVHSRKGTGDTATYLAEAASQDGELERLFITQGKEDSNGKAYTRYADRAKKSRNREVSNHFMNGMGIHHAGMLRGDRKLTEQMFSEGAIKVLCCTATLAWGVNLPAHTVVIKGTDIYNPEKGKMTDLSILDVQQIFGRAGRPQFDTSGEATLITNYKALPRYLDKMVRAVPIESNFIKQLADHLNAEVVGGTVTNLDEAVTWLGYTYLYVRMLKNPLAYGITADQKDDDPMLRNRCKELIEQAAVQLSENKMVTFHYDSGNLSMTDLGRVAAHFYIQAESVAVFQEMLGRRPSATDADLFAVIASATEFEQLRMRPEEQDELDKLKGSSPLKYDGPIHDSATKAFVLMQAYISRERIKGFTLISDMNYIAANAGRVARAIFEMCMKNNKAGIALKLLRIAKCFDHRFWWFQTPLRHFEDEIKPNLIKAIESRQLGAKKGSNAFEDTLAMLDMTADEVGGICRTKKDGGQKIQSMIKLLPRPEIECRVMPVTQDVLRFKIKVLPDFRWNGRWHKGSQSYWLWIEDTDSDRIHHSEHINFSKKNYPDPVELDVPVPAFRPLPSQYIVRVVSDFWVGVETMQAMSLHLLNLPQQETPYTNLLDLTPLPTTVLDDKRYEGLYSRVETFNPIQTQLFHVLYHTDSPVLLGAPTGSGKTFVAEIALLRMKRLYPDGICVYIAPLKSLAKERLKEWRAKLASPPLRWSILELSGDTHHDQRALEKADVLVCTPEKWDLISRGWRGSIGSATGSNVVGKKSFIKRVRLLVIDEIHLLGEERGAVLEAIVSRTRFISQHLETEGVKNVAAESGSGLKSELARIVGLSTAVANPLDLADWMGIDTKGHGPLARRGLYNFRPSIRPVPTKIHVQGYPGKHYCPRMATMNKPCYAAIKQHAPDKPSLIFVASRRQTRLTAFDIISYAAGEEKPTTFLGCDETYINSIANGIHDEALRHTIQFGIGLHHAGLSLHDREIVERLYLSGDIRVLVATATLAWGVNLPARLVIVKGTEYYDGKSSRYVDYPLTDVLQMIGRAGRPGFDTEGRAVVLVETSKKSFYKKFLYSPFPVESCLTERMCENINAEIAIGTVNSLLDVVGYLTWTFFARRVKQNPAYYGAESSSEEHVQAFLLSVAKETLQKLKKEGCVEMDDKDDTVDATVSSTSLGAACTSYYLQYRTPKQMQFGIRQARKIILGALDAEEDSAKYTKPTMAVNTPVPFDRSPRVDDISSAWLLYALSSTHEFDELPVRHNEEIMNEELSDTLMWGPDTSRLLSGSDDRAYVNPEIYEDPHTKCFLLLQAHLESAKLPISDYVNDTKSVTENIPRLLAAMNYIAVQDSTTAGSFELVTQFSKVRQLLETRTIVKQNPLCQLSGIGADLVQRLSTKPKHGNGVAHSMRSLRSMPQNDCMGLLRKLSKGKPDGSFKKIMSSLYAAPLITIQQAKVTYVSGKDSSQNKGKIAIELEINRQSKRTDDDGGGYSIALILGTVHNRLLLGYSTIQVPRGGTSQMKKEIEFDWAVANAGHGEAGGSVILRVLIEGIRGLDSEMLVSLR